VIYSEEADITEYNRGKAEYLTGYYLNECK